MGWDGFVDSLKTPQGAAMLLYDILLFKTSGGGGRVSPSLPEPEPEPVPPPRIPARPPAEIDVEPAPTPSAARRGGAQVDIEPDEPTTPGASTPEVTEPEPSTAAPRTGAVDPDETMHEGKPSYGKPTDVEIAGEDHELVVTKEDDGKPRVRICSQSCDFVVKKLKAARDTIDDTPENAGARARMADLIEEGEQIDKEFATNADREARRTWKDRLGQYQRKLSDASDQYPEIGDALSEVLSEGKPLLGPGDKGYTGSMKQPSWRLVSKGAGAHLFERANVKNRPSFAKLDQSGTPRYYPETSPENAGQAHLRLHDATDAAGVDLGGSTMTNDELIAAYKTAYSSPSLAGIKGDLRTPNGGLVLATDVTPGVAFDKLLEWAGF